MTSFCIVFIDFWIDDFLILILFHHFNPSFDLSEPCIIFFIVFWKFIITKLMLKLSLHGSSAVWSAPIFLFIRITSFLCVRINWSMSAAYVGEMCFSVFWASLRRGHPTTCSRSGSMWRTCLVMVSLVEAIVHNLGVNIVVVLCVAFIVAPCSCTVISSAYLDVSSIDCTLNLNALW